MNAFSDEIVVKGGRARFMGRSFICSIGRGGVRSNKKEGDGATPSGTFDLLAPLYRADRVKLVGSSRAKAIGPRDIWSDDPDDPRYNRLIKIGRKAEWSHERMTRADKLYDIVIPTSYNWQNPKPGDGSAIFLHVWRGPMHPTEGCIAFDRCDMTWIAGKTTCRTRLVVRE